MPKVSIDGQSHGELLLMAVGSGITAAFVIIMILISVIRGNSDADGSKSNEEPKVRQHGQFVMRAKKLSSKNSNASSQRTNLMFNLFGKSLRTFDIEQPASDWKFFNNCAEKRECYRQNILDSISTVENSLAISCIHFFDAQNTIGVTTLLDIE